MNENAFQLVLGCCTMIVAVLALLSFRRALKTGTTGIFVWFRAMRCDQPILFWLCAGFQAFAGALLLWLAILEARPLLP